MKKLIIALLVLVIVSIGVYWFLARPKDTTEKTEPVPLAITGKSDAFTAGMADLMTTYYGLKDAFVNWDTIAANKAAVEIQTKAQALPMTDLKADTFIFSFLLQRVGSGPSYMTVHG